MLIYHLRIKFLISFFNLIASLIHVLNKSLKHIDFACDYSFDWISHVLICAVLTFHIFLSLKLQFLNPALLQQLFRKILMIV